VGVDRGRGGEGEGDVASAGFGACDICRSLIFFLRANGTLTGRPGQVGPASVRTAEELTS